MIARTADLRPALRPRLALDAAVWVFDCDGVLLDSNAMKTHGFAEVLTRAGHPAEAIEAFVAFQRGAFGMSRFRLMDAFFDRFLGRAPGPRETEALLAAFGSYCRASYPRQPLIPGTLDLLGALAEAGATAYVASGSAEDELRAVLAEIGIARHFAAIYGSPTPKTEIVGTLRARHPGADMVLLGDAKADMEAAEAHDVPFVYVAGYTADPDTMAGLQAARGFAAVTDLGAIVPAAAGET